MILGNLRHPASSHHDEAQLLLRIVGGREIALLPFELSDDEVGLPFAEVIELVKAAAGRYTGAMVFRDHIVVERLD